MTPSISISPFREATLLKAYHKPHGLAHQKRKAVWVPAWAYRVLVLTKGEMRLNVFQRVLLALCASGTRTVSALSSASRLPDALVQRIVVELQHHGYLTSRYTLTEEGQHVLEHPYRETEPVPVVGYVYQDAARGGLFPAYITLHEHRHVRAQESGGSYRYGLRLPTSAPSTPPTVEGIARALRRIRQVGYATPEMREALRNLQDASIRVLSNRPQACWLRTQLFYPTYAQRKTDWVVTGPFTDRPDPALRTFIHDNMDHAELAQHLRPLAGELPDEPDARHDGVRTLHAAYDRAVDELEHRLGEHLYDDAELHRYLFNALAGRELATFFENWAHGDINPTWGTLSLHEPTVLNAGRACEALLKRLWTQYPYHGTVTARRYPQRATNGQRRKVNQKNKDRLISLVQAIGFPRFRVIDHWHFVKMLGGLGDQPITPHKASGFRRYLLFTMLSAEQHENHPLRRLAERDAKGLTNIDLLASYRNPAAHASDESRMLERDEVDAAVETTLLLAETVLVHRSE